MSSSSWEFIIYYNKTKKQIFYIAFVLEKFKKKAYSKKVNRFSERNQQFCQKN
jgi:hypothetical protein